MRNFLILLTWLSLMTGQDVSGQHTVGLLSYNDSRSFDGYNLLYPHNQPHVYLLNNCGEIVHVWEDDPSWRPGNTAYITEEGNLYKTKRSAGVTSDRMWAGGGGAILEIRDWENNLLWDFEMNNDSFRLHHDFAITQEGTIIALAWELKTLDQCLAAGRDTTTLAQGELWPDWVFEIDPELDSIIWEWHAWDHLVQDHDPAKDNFGVVADHPELIDVNYGRPDGHPDWLHSNAIDYNPVLDQVMISVPYFDEIWIIDHTTTTEQAAGHTGGFSGIGGDLMYRWGNPQTYDQGDSTDQQFFFQHDAQWVDDFLDFAFPEYGRITVFNNRIGPDYSAVNLLEQPWDMYNWEYSRENQVFLPDTTKRTITHPDRTALYSTGLSSVQWLPNGNVLITSGRFGYTFELTPDNEIVWEYITPLSGGQPVEQGATLDVNQNLTFRVKRYPADFPGFEGKDLGRKGWIELNPDTSFCTQIVSSIEEMNEDAFRVYPNPASRFLAIEWDGMRYADIRVYDLNGRPVHTVTASGGRTYIDLSGWENGIYFIGVHTPRSVYTRKVIIE